MSETITAKGYNGQVSFDGRFVTISRSGFVARITVLAACLSAHSTMINGSALCAALAATERG